MLFLREVYPYLVAKNRQAMVAYNLLLMVPEAKRVGHSSGRDAAREKRAFLVQMLSDLNQGRPVDLPSWLVEPPSVFEPGWYLRQDIIWHKPNPMPESVQDRCTKAHEYLFLLAKSERYYFDHEAIKEPGVIPAGTKGAKGSAERAAQKGVNSRPPEYKVYDGMRNKRSVWTVTTKPFRGAHFATFPPDLVEPCILAGSRPGDLVLDPFGGSGTTALVARQHGRRSVLMELNPDYIAIAKERLGLNPEKEAA